MAEFRVLNNGTKATFNYPHLSPRRGGDGRGHEIQGRFRGNQIWWLNRGPSLWRSHPLPTAKVSRPVSVPDASGGVDFVQGRARGVSGPEEEVEQAEPSRWETTVRRERVRFRKLISPETTDIVFLQTSPRGKLSFITIAVTDEEDERYPRYPPC